MREGTTGTSVSIVDKDNCNVLGDKLTFWRRKKDGALMVALCDFRDNVYKEMVVDFEDTLDQLRFLSR